MRRSSVLTLVLVVCFTAVTALAAESELQFRVQRLTDRVIVFTELSP